MKNSLTILVFSLLLSCQSKKDYSPLSEPVSFLFDETQAPFYHGVASGDPLESSVIIWTRVTPENAEPEVAVEWQMALTDDFSEIVSSGASVTTPERDYTVKIDVEGLSSDQSYFYRFQSEGKFSPVGRTKTAAQNADELSFAVVSCSNYEWGYFTAYEHIANRQELDAVIHLGDYIYEYGPGKYGDTTIGRFNLPAKEIISLEDYRTRYSQYRLDKDLQEAHTKHPFITIWDDHEIANNSYKTGAQNHQEDEGSYENRSAAAVQAYYEWLPIRENVDHYRSFSYGNLVDLIMLDERLEGRTRPLDSLNDPALQDESRSILGVEQRDWLFDRLASSEAKWKIIGNQVIFSYLNWGYEPDFTINLDSWDGYPVEQKMIADFIKEETVGDVIFITGDTHSSWAFEVSVDPKKSYDQKSGEGAFAIEFGTTSINSSNSDERYDKQMVLEHEDKIINSPINPHLKYANLRDHGYLLLSLSDEKASADWFYVSTVREKDSEEFLGKSLFVNAGEAKLRE